MKKDPLQIITLCLCLVLLGITIHQNQLLEEYQSQTQREIWELEDTLSNEIDNLSYDIVYELEQAARVVSDHTLTLNGADTEQQLLLAEAQVELREWSADTQVELLVCLEEEILTFPMTREEDRGLFTAQLSFPWTDGLSFSLEAAISSGGQATVEELDSWGWYSLLPLQASGGSWSGPNYENGVMSSSFSLSLTGSVDGDTLRDPVFLIYKNGELADTIPARMENNGEFTGELSFVPDLPGQVWSIDCEEWDVIDIRFRCTDELGLGYDFYFASWTAEGDVSGNVPGYSTDLSRQEFILHWPE